MKDKIPHYPDFEQSFLFEGYESIKAVPQAGLIAARDEKGNVIFYDDEYPALENDGTIYKKRISYEDRRRS